MPDALSLAVDLMNTVDLLNTPADRLGDLEPLRRRLRTSGWPELADSLPPDALPAVVELRERLRAVFHAESVPAAAALLNALLAAAGAVPRLVPGEAPDAVELRATAPPAGVDGLQVLLADALARHVTRHGIGRLGVCDGSPCRCVFVDRTKAARQRYCCTLCSDRIAAAAYRRRRSEPTATRTIGS